GAGAGGQGGIGDPVISTCMTSCCKLAVCCDILAKQPVVLQFTALSPKPELCLGTVSSGSEDDCAAAQADYCVSSPSPDLSVVPPQALIVAPQSPSTSTTQTAP